MISPNVPSGVPRPIGSEYLHRQVWATAPPTSREPSTCLWYVSVVRSVGGETIEAKPVHRAPMVATDLKHHTLSPGFHDVLLKVRKLLDTDEGWTHRKVERCRVKGCGNGAPMWTRRGDKAECSSCAARTVVACVECGQPDIANYVNRERMLARQLCFGCDLWTDRAAEPPKLVSHADPPVLYGIGKGTGPSSCKGFGGRRWVVTFDDGRVVNTDDLWYGGEVPAWFQDRIKPNATVEPAERKAVQA